MSSLWSFSNVEVEKSLLHKKQVLKDLQLNSLEKDPHSSIWCISPIPFVFSNTIVPFHGGSSSSSSPVHLVILLSCHLALFLTTGDLYNLISFYTINRWLLHQQNVRHILWVALQSRQMSMSIYPGIYCLIIMSPAKTLCGYFDIRLVVFINKIWSQYSPH